MFRSGTASSREFVVEELDGNFVPVSGRMALDEEQDHRSDGIGIRTNKKNKHKKAPQRGLGVAQLEKLRLAEQQKTVATAATTAPSSSSHNLPQGLALPSQASVHVMANETVIRPRVDPPLLFRPPPSAASPAIDFFSPASSSTSEKSPVGLVGNAGHGFLPMLWNSVALPGPPTADAPLKREDSSSSNWRPSFLVHRRPPLHQQLPPSTLKTTIPPTSSGVDLQMEPPSNQNYIGTYDLLSSWKEHAQEQEQERMGGIKRSYPFQLDGISDQAPYPCKVPKISNSYPKIDEPPPNYGIYFVKSEPQSSSFRGGISSSYCSNSRSSDTRTEDKRKENAGETDGSFLTLCSIPTPISKPVVNSAFNYSDYTQSGLSASQGSISNGLSSSHEKPFYSFFPPARHEMNSYEQKEAVDDLDLDLKL